MSGRSHGLESLKADRVTAAIVAESEWPPLPSPHTRVGVGGVLIRDGRALVNRAVYRNRFTIPSGYVERGETLVGALVREFEEETGVTVKVDRLVLTRHKVLSTEESDVYFGFRVEPVTGTPEARPPEIAEVREVPLAEAMTAEWISEFSRMAIRLAADPVRGWPLANWRGGEFPGLANEVFPPVD